MRKLTPIRLRNYFQVGVTSQSVLFSEVKQAKERTHFEIRPTLNEPAVALRHPSASRDVEGVYFQSAIFTSIKSTQTPLDDCKQTTRNIALVAAKLWLLFLPTVVKLNRVNTSTFALALPLLLGGSTPLGLALLKEGGNFAILRREWYYFRLYLHSKYTFSF